MGEGGRAVQAAPACAEWQCLVRLQAVGYGLLRQADRQRFRTAAPVGQRCACSLCRCCCCCGAGDVEGGQPEQAGGHVSSPPACLPNGLEKCSAWGAQARGVPASAALAHAALHAGSACLSFWLISLLSLSPSLPLPCACACSYNFAKEEAVFNYEHTRGALKLGALYNL